MGEGFFGIDRPGTAGDSGWLGAPRPFVGAANGIKATVTTDSAAEIAVENETPQVVINTREELNEVNRQLENVRTKLTRIKEAREERRIFGLADFDISMERVESLMERERRLEQSRDDLDNELRRMEQEAEAGDIPMHEIERGVQEPVENALRNMGVSKGPFVTVRPEQTEILFSKVNVREEDIEMTRNNLDGAGFRVLSVECVEINKLFD